MFHVKHMKHGKGERMLTKNGVCYDLSKSEYKHKEGNLIFVFSSQLHMKKFVEKLEENRDILNYSLTRRFNIPVNISELADVVLYRKIETRGFLIVTSEGNELWPKEIIYCGGVMKQKNSSE